MRLGFALLTMALVGGWAWEYHLKITDPTPPGVAAAYSFSTKFAILGAAAAGGMIATLGYFSGKNKDAANKLKDKYQQLAARAAAIDKNRALQAPAVLAAEQTTLSSLPTLKSGLPTSSSTPDMSGLVGEGTSAGERPLLRAGALTADGQTHEDATPAMPETPAATMPTLAQVTTMSGQTAKISGHAPQHMSLSNQTMGQVRQLASMGQPGQRAAPVEEAASEKAAPEEEGAALGTEAAERVPVEVGAANLEQAQEPTRKV